ncbi:MAG TPA: FAD:protein FMN transferase [Thiobacillaceae bacterium]|nr:FAD:protein FMN transferase [Thiobacillaceae bacterium]HNU65423.1 FAD:protein FMN transferase [Thiobacillaceae bacterium]
MARARSTAGSAGAWSAWLALCLVSLLLSGCGAQIHRQQAYVFGTLVEITLHGEDPGKARQAADALLRDFDRMHRDLHPWEPGPLEALNSRLARATPRTPARIDLATQAELHAILTDATRMSILSEGLFNPAIGNLVRLWGFHGDTFTPRLPDPVAIARLVAARPGMGDLQWQGDVLVCRNPAVRIDLGGYAKGYALDRAARLLRDQGVKNALINIGGNIMALGDKGGTPWKVGIQHPRRAGALAVLALRDGEAIGTSGDYQRFFEVDGRRYSHLIDPRTGWPARQAQAVTVIARGPGAGVLSDVASKPLFIASATDWRRLAGKMGIDEALRVAADGTIHVTRAMNSRLEWERPVSTVRVEE